MNISVYRTVEESGRVVKMDVEYTPRTKSVAPDKDYAIYPNDRIVVESKTNTTIDKIASWANLVLIAVPAFIVLGIAGWFLGRALSSKNRHLAAVGAEFSELFELSPDALIALDKNGDVKRVNQKAVELTGYERSHLSNLNISQLVSTFAVSDHSKLSALWEGALDKDLSERTTSEIALTRKSGDAIEVEVELTDNKPTNIWLV